MRERKNVKFRIDMYDDTKFKIIDMKPERDLINYIWTRLVILAGKVNLDGNLYMSKNSPYTIETLAIEFNRGIDQIKLALNVLMELEMIEFTEDDIYMVKNFAKHQNIKVKEEIKSKDNNKEIINEDVGDKKVQAKEDFKSAIKNEDSKIGIYNNENLKNEVHLNKDKKPENKISQNNVEKVVNNMKSIRNSDVVSLEITDNNIAKKHIDKTDNNMSTENANSSSQDPIPIFLETKKNKKLSKKKKKDSDINIIEEKIEDKSMFCFYGDNQERPLGEDESIVSEWAF